VNELGGRIELAPTSSKGALFRMILPACAPSAHSRPNTATGPRNGDRLRVLVIDDEAPLARALGLMLEDDHDVEVVTSGEDALKRFEAGAEYDAILCDLMMAGIGGMEVHSKLVNGRPALARRLVFMTGGAFGANVQKFLGAVKNPCLDKPFTREQALGAMNMVRDLG
jgi:CheY-like chemotaxis protein